MIQAKGTKREGTYTTERTIYNLDEAIRFAEDMGTHFFEPGTMNFFHSRVNSDFAFFKIGKVDAVAFCTSEKRSGLKRRYTARFILLNGKQAGEIKKISTEAETSGFQLFETSAQARAVIKGIKAGKYEFSPLNAENAKHYKGIILDLYAKKTEA